VERRNFIKNIEEGVRETGHIITTGEPLSESLNLTQAAALQDFVVYHERLHPGRRASSPHSHSHREEFVLVLRGTPQIWIDGCAHPLRPGDYVGLTAGTGIAHYLENRGTETAEYLLVASLHSEDEIIYHR
jgi:uncharacterized cupin superfamily protein